MEYQILAEKNENPTLSRTDCIRLIRHGGATIIRIAGIKVCLTCFTEVTEKDIEQRIKDIGGPGHWLGCVLPKNHEGDCVVKR